jgi:hypothetical protein
MSIHNFSLFLKASLLTQKTLSKLTLINVNTRLKGKGTTSFARCLRKLFFKKWFIQFKTKSMPNAKRTRKIRFNLNFNFKQRSLILNFFLFALNYNKGTLIFNKKTTGSNLTIKNLSPFLLSRFYSNISDLDYYTAITINFNFMPKFQLKYSLPSLFKIYLNSENLILETR